MRRRRIKEEIYIEGRSKEGVVDYQELEKPSSQNNIFKGDMALLPGE